MLAILLAAGRGLRLGTDKATVDLAGASALQRCLSALADGGATSLRVVVAPGADLARAQAEAVGATVVVNQDPSRGQTSSLRTALVAGVDGPGFLLHTVDHPLVRADDVDAVLQQFVGRPAGCEIVVPSVGGRRGHPTAFAAGLVEEFLALPDGEPGHTVLRRQPERVLHVEREDAWLVRDLDTPQDLEAARAALAAGR